MLVTICSLSNSLFAGTSPGLVLWVEMQLEVLLDVQLTWQLLLQFIRLLGHLSHGLLLCSCARIEGEAVSAHRHRWVFGTGFRYQVGCEVRLPRQI